MNRLPWGVGLAVGMFCILLGAVLTVRPFASIAVLLVVLVVGLLAAGVGELLADAGRLRVARGVLYLTAALIILFWRGPTVLLLTIAVGVALIAVGILNLIEARRCTGRRRWSELIGGIAAIVFGVLALAWPDVTVLAVAVAFGAQLIILGARLIAAAIRRARGRAVGSPAEPVEPAEAEEQVGWGRLLLSVGALAAALALLMVSTALWRGSPRPDTFYTAPAALPAEPGQLLRAEPFTRMVPADAQGWRILYTTTRDEGQPAVASAIVVAPTGASATPRPLIAWAHGTTGYAEGCAPSLLAEPFESGALFVADQLVAQGWVLVATDYPGLGTAGPHPYLIGQGEGRSVLDAVRAARSMSELNLSDQNVVWGHSQGGHAALWAGVLAPSYAPELTIAGVAALAPASNLPGLIENLGEITGGSLFAAYVMEAYAAVYPEVDHADYVRPAARPIVREYASRCLGEPSVLVSVLTSLVLDKPIWSGDPDSGALHVRLAENVPSGPIAAPLLLGQGGADSLVVPSAQDAYVAARCAAGYQVDYRVYPGRDHVPLVQPDSPAIQELLAWTQDRLAGAAARGTC